ncbi:MAG: tetratricopeptide repeat protein [Sphingobacteriaceae bacterium]|nr:MAG: tetratricopeptide repeat protein [Sphingobacteriaceae bacterium]
MKSKLFIAALVLLPNVLHAQDFRSRFRELGAQDDTTATLNLLNTWRKAAPNDPELYVAFYNFYAKEGLKEVISIEQNQHGGQSLEMKDSTGKVAGYINSRPGFNATLINKGFKYIDTGIVKFPARLDMRFGKVYIMGKGEMFNEFTQEIIKAIEYGESIGLKWTWTDNKSLEKPKEFMLKTIQSYVYQLLNVGDKQAGNIRLIAEKVLKYHPDHVESLSNLAVTYMISKDYSRALESLLKAENLAPQDFIVLNNIAYSYAATGDKQNAIKYYELVIKYGDEAAQKNAKEKIKNLKK